MKLYKDFSDAVESCLDSLNILLNANGGILSADNRDFILEYLDRNFLRQPKFYGTIGEASKFYKDNIVLITTRGHIVASKFGEVVDTWDSTNRKVEFVWLVR